jgi:hypothetical protein
MEIACVYVMYDRIDTLETVRTGMAAGRDPYDIAFDLMQVRDGLQEDAISASDLRLLDNVITRLERFDEEDVYWFRKNGWLPTRR